MYDDWERKSTSEKVWSIIGTGLLAAPTLYALTIVIEFVACFCTCGQVTFFGCGPGEHGKWGNGLSNTLLPSMWSWSTFGSAFIFLTIVGVVIGIVYAIAANVQKSKDEREIKHRTEEEEFRAINLKLRQENANYFKQKASRTIDQCLSNKDNGDRVILQPDYEGISLQSKLWNALNDVSIPLQKLENIVSEFSTKKEDK